MKKGISQLSFQDEMSVIEVLKLSKKFGFEGVELMLKEEGDFSIDSSESQIKAIGKQAQDIGIEIASLVSLIPWFHPLTASDAGSRAKGMESIEKMLAAAAVLDIETILVVPGVVGSVFFLDTPVVAYDTAYERSQKAIMELAQKAEQYKVNLGIENVWNNFLLSPLEFRDFIDQTNSPYVVAYFDVGNVLPFGYSEQWIRILDSRIKKVHIKDFKLSIGNMEGFVGLLQGDVNWKEVIKALKEIGYNDYLIAEIAPYASFPLKTILDISTSMDEILKL